MTNISLTASQLTARQSESSRVALKLEVHINNTWVSLGDDVISGSVTDAIADIMGYARSNTASIVLDNRDKCYSSKIFQPSIDISKKWFNGPADSVGLGKLSPGLPARIYENIENTGWIKKFQGYVDDNGFQETISKNIGVVQVSFEDEMYKLKRATFKEQTRTFESAVICDPLNKASSLVHILLDEKGFDSNNLICETILRTVPFVSLDGTLYDILNDIAKSCLCIFTMNNDGFFYFGSSPFCENYVEPVSQYTLNGNIKSLTVKSNRNSIINSVSGKLQTAGYQELQCIWKNQEVIRIQPGETNSPITNPGEEFECVFGTNSGDRVIYARNIDTLEEFNTGHLGKTSLTGLGLTIDRYETGVKPDSVGLRLANNTAAEIIIPAGDMQIFGEPLVVLTDVDVEDINQYSIDRYGLKEEDLSSPYIYEPEYMQQNVTAVLDRKKDLKEKISVSVTEPLTHIVAGSLLTVFEKQAFSILNNADEYIDNGLLCRVRSARTDYARSTATVTFELDQWVQAFFGVFDGTTTSYNAYSATTTLTINNDNQYVIDGINTGISTGISPKEYLTGFSREGGSMIPSAVFVASKSLYGATQADFSVNNSLTNLSHYVVQVLDGDIWKVPDNDKIFGIEDKLIIPNSLFIHSGLEKDTTYDYRVASVTKAGLQGDWYNYSITTSSLTSKGLAFNSISANHLTVDSVNINQLTFSGIGDEAYPVIEKRKTDLLFECNNDLKSTSLEQLQGSAITVENGRTIPGKEEINIETEFDLRKSKGKYVAKKLICGKLGMIDCKDYIGKLGTIDKVILFGG